jgi:hypothetical protein
MADTAFGVGQWGHFEGVGLVDAAKVDFILIN